MLCEYIRDKNKKPIGCIVALCKDGEDEVSYGISLYNPKDEYSRSLGRQIAIGRAYSYNLEEPVKWIPEFIPAKKKALVEKALVNMVFRADRYFKQCQEVNN